MKKYFIIFFILILIFAIVIGIDFFKKIRIPYQGYDKEIKIHVKKGSSVTTVANLLHQNKIIPNKTYFIVLYKLLYKKLTFKTGEYLFNKPLTMKDIIKKLDEGKVILYKITVKEGLTLSETIDLLAQKHNLNQTTLLAIAQNPTLITNLNAKARDLEGYLFPDTYMVPKTIIERELIETMVNKFKTKYSSTLRLRTKEMNMTIHEVITLASLIEKETASREERFLISSVFHNRLRIGMPLACDPTIIYALKLENNYTGKLRWADLKLDSPYNTRIYKGLPPGPICSPGYDSIEAVLYPASSKYLYFVAKSDSHHHFSKTLKEHNWAVRKYIINKKK